MTHPPIFLIGTHRSGTTWTGRLLSQADEFAYWVEPRQVWSYGNYNKPDDLLTAADASPKIKSHIRRRFEKFMLARGKKRFCEKTPSNCLRIPFMREVFPEAKFVLIVRDGRAVYRSTEEIKQKSADWNRIWSRIRESSWRELPAFYDRIPLLVRKVTGQKLNFWGVKPPGWQEWLRTHTPQQVTALQWAKTISIAYEAFHNLPDENRLLVRFEDMLSETESQVRRLAEFAEINDPEQLVAYASHSVNRKSNTKWQDELEPELLDSIRPIMEPVLLKIGYQW